MEAYVNHQLELMLADLDGIDRKGMDTEYFSTCYHVVEKYISVVRDFAKTYTFSDIHEEILFYKHWFPSMLWRGVYYDRVYNVHFWKRRLSAGHYLELLERELIELDIFLQRFAWLDDYLIKGDQAEDLSWFSSHRAGTGELSLAFEAPQSLTNAYLVAQLLAVDPLRNYLEAQAGKRSVDALPQMEWVAGSPSALELCMGLKLTKAIKINGKDPTFKDLVETLMNAILHANLTGDVYKASYKLRQRKRTVTPYLDEMKVSITDYNDKLDEG
jgi:hypothetical protein